MSNKISTRKVYGQALVELGKINSEVMVLDAEVSNSTFAELFKNEFPERFVECFIAEQNMISMALGMARLGKIPFCSTFGAFLTRCHDQIRMCQYSLGNVKIVGSHAGVSIGEDGASQMALEDIAMFRSMLDSVVLYPSDGTSCSELVKKMAEHKGLVYLRTTRADTDVLYTKEEKFEIGGSKILKFSNEDVATIIGAGITLHEAVKAHEFLKNDGIMTRIIDLYSIKPLDVKAVHQALQETKHLVVVEDHFVEGGIYEAVVSELIQKYPGSLASTSIHSLAVKKMPCSGKPEELLKLEEIDADAIIKKIKEVLVV